MANELELKHDFERFDLIQPKKINGNNYLSVDGQMLNSEYQMRESDFVHNWLHQFAIGWVGGKCYFDLETWKQFTNNGMMSVVVIKDDTNESLFVIKPLIETDLTDDERTIARQVGENLTRVAETPDGMLAKNIYQQSAAFLKAKINRKVNTYTDVIPDTFYTKYGLIPWVMKRVIYIRDEFGYQPDSKTIEVIQEVLTAYHNKELLTDKQLEFIKVATHGTLELNNDSVKVNSVNQQSCDEESDIGEC